MPAKLTQPTSPYGKPAHVLRANTAANTARNGVKVTFKPISPANDTNTPCKARPANARTVVNSSKSQHYQGQELKPYQGRPGSLDFLTLPSLFGSTRRYRADQQPPATTATTQG